MSGRSENDIKALDGYTLGGLRLVRSDGTILFQRGYWQAPKEWAGEKVWVHEKWTHDGALVLDAAHPGLHIYAARMMSPPHVKECERTDRPDAKHGRRNPAVKTWFNRNESRGADQ